MDIDIQTILQQDIDLGIKKSLNLDFQLASSSYGSMTPTSSTEDSLDFEFLNYYGQNYSKEEIQLKKYLDGSEENQKNADIIATTDLFESQMIPDGYKVVLEEDTGECILILMSNDSNKSNYSRIEMREYNVTNLISTTNLSSLRQSQEDNLNIKVNINVCFDNEKMQFVRAPFDSEKPTEEEKKAYQNVRKSCLIF